MRILIAPDKFKGTLTATQVCEAIHRGLVIVSDDIEVKEIPMADGGEGTGETLTLLSGGSVIQVEADDPLGRPIKASYGLSRDGSTAFIEMASASGLQLLKPADRNPLNTSTHGTGQLIRHAMEHGARTIVLGIGGSATNDAGMGMARALGFQFYAGRAEIDYPVGDDLNRLDRIDATHTHDLLAQTRFVVLCDVMNPLYGPSGAAQVYGPQKGADELVVRELDAGLENFAQIVLAMRGPDLQFPGAGAAGGLGAGARFFLGAEVVSGFEYVAAYSHLRDHIIAADLVITGEGKLDAQTRFGKVVKGVADLAFRSGKPCLALAGISTLSGPEIKALHLADVAALVEGSITESEAVHNAFNILVDRAAEVFARQSRQ